MTLSVDDYMALDAPDIAAGVKTRRLSAREVAEAALRRMDAVEPHIHAFSLAAPELALAAAAAVDEKVSRGEDAGVLAGVPLGIKDLIATKDMVTSMGSIMYEGFRHEEDDIVVERLRAAGAVILGKTNVSEFGYSGVSHNRVFPATRNPWNLALTSGGSSSGSAASVAARVSPISIGSDGGGSVRGPSAFCNLVGVKPSMGRVPLWPGCRDARYPGFSSWESLEHIGPMTRTVEGAALVLSAIAGPDMRDRHSIPQDVDWLGCLSRPLPKLRIAFSEDFGYMQVDPEVRRVFREAVGLFGSTLGATLGQVDPEWGDTMPLFRTLVAADSDISAMRKWLPDYRDKMSVHLREMLEKNYSAEDFTDAHRRRQEICVMASRIMRDHDLFLCPTQGMLPFDVDLQAPPVGKSGSFAHVFNLTGQPAASVPAGFSQDDLPVGLQIVGRHLDDALVMRAAKAFQDAMPAHRRVPRLPISAMRAGAA